MIRMLAKHSSPARHRRNRLRAHKQKLVFAIAGFLKAATSFSCIEDVKTETRGHSDADDFCSGSAANTNLTSRSEDRTAVVFDLLFNAVTSSGTSFGKFARHFIRGRCEANIHRVRGVFPIPRYSRSDEDGIGSLSDFRSRVVVSCINLTLAGLSYLFDARLPLNGRNPTTAQRSVHRNIARKVLDCFSRLDGITDYVAIEGAFAKLVKRHESGAFPEFIADACDTLEQCGVVDTAPFLDESLAEVLQNPSKLFPNGVDGVSRIARFCAGSRREYLKLVVSHLRSGKVVLSSFAHCSGTVFAVGKPGGSRLREVWHGGAISSSAVPPPHPPSLGSPTALVRLEASRDRPIYMAKKDARCYFDQLRLPEQLQAFMGRPTVFAQELLDVEGFTQAELIQYLPSDVSVQDVAPLFPCNRTWAMGFSWSSFVGQSVMVGSCKLAGIAEPCFLCDDSHRMNCSEENVSVCTDDVIHFSRCPLQGRVRMEALDEVWNKLGILQHEGKAIYDGELNGTALGIDLCHGISLGPGAQKMDLLLHAAVELFHSPYASPEEVASFTGTLQWFDLLNRWMLSSMNATYAFNRSLPADMRQRVPDQVVEELMLNISLCFCWEVGLQRTWHNELIATDACPHYGFGVAVARASCDVVKALASISGDSSAYVRCRRSRMDPPEKPRQGNGYRLPLRQNDFKAVLSLRARRKYHSGTLEAEAVALGMDWLSRSWKKHSKRLVFLVDATAVKCACAKGRTSAGTLRRAICRCSALAIACDWLAHFVYVPSESNPSDKASRGRRSRPPVRRAVRKSTRKPKRTELEEWIDSLLLLEERGLISCDACSDTTSSDSGRS